MLLISLAGGFSAQGLQGSGFGLCQLHGLETPNPPTVMLNLYTAEDLKPLALNALNPPLTEPSAPNPTLKHTLTLNNLPFFLIVISLYKS